MKKLWLVAAAALALGASQSALAFPGFYVASGDDPRINDATQVVLVRDGTRTVLAMRPSYHGPADAFALVIPVPATVQERDITVVAPDVFAAVEQLGAPRLVEYWEQDPCVDDKPKPSDDEVGTKREAAFTAGEYQISIVAPKDAAGLDAWLRRDKLQLPAAALPLLQTYIEGGMKLVVAKVDPGKVELAGDRVVLSPLRVHYDSERFTLPIRIGLANSAGTQDLIVSILAPHQRYLVAGYPHVTIPTNLIVHGDVRERFGTFYVELFDATLDKHPGAVITEYAADVTTLDDRVLQALGADQLGRAQERDFVLTRLHARYGKAIKADLELEPAEPIAGGREQLAPNGKLEQGARASSFNDFQARYVIRRPWTGPLTCTNPVRGRWGGKDGRARPDPGTPALDLATLPRGTLELASALAQDVPELDLELVGDPLTPAPKLARGPEKRVTGCGCQSTDAGGGLALCVAAVLLWSRRRRSEAA